MISRRGFLKAMAAVAILYPSRNSFAFSPAAERSLTLRNIHTDELLAISYYYSGRYDYEALEKINHILRCHHTDKVKAIDINLLDLLCDIKDRLGTDREIRIISGYRSPEYNAYLRSRSRRVAKDSLHLSGLAIDFAIDGYNNSALSRIAKSFTAGGVGRYQEFVHIDVGPIRYW